MSVHYEITCLAGGPETTIIAIFLINIHAYSFIDQVAKEYGLSGPCSAYQVLFGGCKGILTIDPDLPGGEVHYRPSMKHFDSSDKILEVVDHSRPRELVESNIKDNWFCDIYTVLRLSSETA